MFCERVGGLGVQGRLRGECLASPRTHQPKRIPLALSLLGSPASQDTHTQAICTIAVYTCKNHRWHCVTPRQGTYELPPGCPAPSADRMYPPYLTWDGEPSSLQVQGLPPLPPHWAFGTITGMKLTLALLKSAEPMSSVKCPLIKGKKEPGLCSILVLGFYL